MLAMPPGISASQRSWTIMQAHFHPSGAFRKLRVCCWSACNKHHNMLESVYGPLILGNPHKPCTICNYTRPSISYTIYKCTYSSVYHTLYIYNIIYSMYIIYIYIYLSIIYCLYMYIYICLDTSYTVYHTAI